MIYFSLFCDKKYLLRKKPGIICYSHNGRILCICNHKYWGSLPPFTSLSYIAGGVFSQILHSDFQANTLKVPSKPREKKRKGICSSCIPLRSEDERLFCDSYLIWWFHLLDKNSTLFLSSSITLQKKTSLREALGCVIFASSSPIPCYCARDEKNP